MVDALERDFGAKNRAEVFRAELKVRRKKEGESMMDLARDIRCLTSLAFPCSTAEAIETMAVDRFKDCLDPEIGMAVQQKEANTLNQAATIAMGMEAFRSAEKQKNTQRKLCRVINGEEENTEDDDLKDMIRKLVEEIRRRNLPERARATQGNYRRQQFRGRP